MQQQDTGSTLDAAAELHRLLNGFQVTQAIHVAAVLGVADQLDHEPRPVHDIAAEVGADADALDRLLRALAALGVFREHEGRRYSLSSMGACLRSDSAHPVRPYAVFAAQKHQWDAWGALLHSVRTGENAFRAVHGVSSWEYRARDPAQNAIFNAAMTGNSRRIDAAVAQAYDFGRHARIADVGGGQGALLAALLQRNPASRGVLLDRPHVVAGAPAVFATAGVAGRVDIVGGDMFEAVPAGCDAHVLKYILHDWDDARCSVLLARCRDALAGGGRVIVVERLVGAPNQDPAVKLADLHMLVGPGGRERSLDEFAALFAAAGLAIVERRPTAATVGLLVLERA
jgi:hypothetical protein